MPNLGCWWFVVGLAGFVLLIWAIGWVAQAWEERRRTVSRPTHRHGFPIEPRKGDAEGLSDRNGSPGA